MDSIFNNRNILTRLASSVGWGIDDNECRYMRVCDRVGSMKAMIRRTRPKVDDAEKYTVFDNQLALQQ